MSLLWPGFLYSLFLIPLAVAGYIWFLRRRRRFAVRYSSLSLVREAAAKQSWLRRHFPFILFLAALSSLAFALTRPQAAVVVPSNKATVIIAVDVSLSMCSTDIPPNRLEVAKQEARTFVRNNIPGRQVGIVAFAGFAELIQPPTTDVRALDNAIDYLSPGRRTAIGSGILRSLDAIAEVDNRVAPSQSDPSASSPTPSAPKREAIGSSPHIIVLLTDGASNAGPLPIEAAQEAADRGIRIFPIGFGTDNEAATMNCGDGDILGGLGGFGGGGFGGGGFSGGGGFHRSIDDATLKQVADMTGGKYYTAATASELHDALKKLPTYVIATHETIEISVFFTAIAALLGIAAVILGFVWHPLS